MADLLTRHVEEWAVTNSLFSFLSPMLRTQPIAQALKSNMDSSLQRASTTLWQKTLASFVLCPKVPTDKAAWYLFSRLIYGQNYLLICLGSDLDQYIVILNKQKMNSDEKLGKGGKGEGEARMEFSALYNNISKPLRLFLSLQHQESIRVAGPHRNSIPNS